MRYIVHLGTGTVIAEDECRVISVPEETLAEISASGGDDYFDDNLICSLAEESGQPLNSTDLSWRNTIAFSPTALREEAGELLDDYADDDHITKALLWCVNVATDDELNDVASYILDNPDLWSLFRSSVLDGLVEGLRWSKETS